jgi:hypothetical protein
VSIKSIIKFNSKEMVKELKEHEGVKLNDKGQIISYWDGPEDGAKDHRERNLTTGYGHLVKFKENEDGTFTNIDPVKDINGKPITKEGQVLSNSVAEDLFTKDYIFHLKETVKLPHFKDVDKSRQMSLMNYTFNMGPAWQKKFKNAISNFNVAVTSQDPIVKNNAWYMMGQEMLKKDGTDPNSLPSKYIKDTKGRGKFVTERLVRGDG